MSDLVLGGVVLSPIIPALVAALVLTVACSWAAARVRLWRLVWHRPLVEVCIFLMLFAAAGILAPWGWW